MLFNTVRNQLRSIYGVNLEARLTAFTYLLEIVFQGPDGAIFAGHEPNPPLDS